MYGPRRVRKVAALIADYPVAVSEHFSNGRTGIFQTCPNLGP